MVQLFNVIFLFESILAEFLFIEGIFRKISYHRRWPFFNHMNLFSLSSAKRVVCLRKTEKGEKVGRRREGGRERECKRTRERASEREREGGRERKRNRENFEPY